MCGGRGFADDLHLSISSVRGLDVTWIVVFGVWVGGFCILTLAAIVGVLGGFVLRGVWLCLSLCRAGRSIPGSMENGTLFWWWSVALCRYLVLDLGAKAWLVSRNRNTQIPNQNPLEGSPIRDWIG